MSTAYEPRSTLDCQDCGRILHVLSPAEAQKVANDPYGYVLYCRTCAKDHDVY